MREADSTSRANVWSALELAPTTDVGELRRAFASCDVSESRSDELRAAYETALLWLTLGLPPERLDRWDAEAVLESFQSVTESANATSVPRSATECARAFWRSDSFPAETRADAAALHPYVESLATAIERGGVLEETLQALLDLLEVLSLRGADLKRELELLLPLLLVHSMQPAIVEPAVGFFRWRRTGQPPSPFHQMFVGELLAFLYAVEMIDHLREQAGGWWKDWPRDPEPLAAEVLTSGFRPTLFLYASCSERVWFRMQQYWNDLTVLPPSYLQAVLGLQTCEYWSARLAEAPPIHVAIAQRLQLPVNVLSMLAAIAVVITVIAPRVPDTSTTLFAMGLMVALGWSFVLMGHLSFFGVIWLFDRARSRKRESDG